MTTLTAPITRGIPNNQTSTMQAYPAPSYAMPPQQQAILAARSRSASPVYDDASQIDSNRYNALLAGQQGMPAATPVGGFGSAVAGYTAGADPYAGGSPEANADDLMMGPTVQTASGGVMGQPTDFTTPGAWQQFFRDRGHAGARGAPPQTPPVMQGSRTYSPNDPRGANGTPWAPAPTTV